MAGGAHGRERSAPVKELSRDGVKRITSRFRARSCAFWRARNSTARDQQYVSLGMNGWASCCKGALRQAEKTGTLGKTPGSVSATA